MLTVGNLGRYWGALLPNKPAGKFKPLRHATACGGMLQCSTPPPPPNDAPVACRGMLQALVLHYEQGLRPYHAPHPIVGAHSLPMGPSLGASSRGLKQPTRCLELTCSSGQSKLSLTPLPLYNLRQSTK